MTPELLDERIIQRLVQQSRSQSEQPDEHPPMHHELVENRGTVSQFDARTGTGLIEAVDGQYYFYAHDITRGFASVGASVHFRSSDHTFASAIEIG